MRAHSLPKNRTTRCQETRSPQPALLCGRRDFPFKRLISASIDPTQWIIRFPAELPGELPSDFGAKDRADFVVAKKIQILHSAKPAIPKSYSKFEGKRPYQLLIHFTSRQCPAHLPYWRQA